MCCFGYCSSVLNNLLYDDDEDYKDVRQEDKDLNYLFKVGDTWIKIPKGQLISGISATYNRLKNAKDGDDFAFDGYLQELNQPYHLLKILEPSSVLLQILKLIRLGMVEILKV